MPSHHNARTREDVQRELSAILRELKDPRIIDAMLSIVKINIASDLTDCKVYVSSLKGYEFTVHAVTALKAASGFVRHEMAKRLKLRHTPVLYFIADDSIEHSTDISRILGKLEVRKNDD